MLDELIDFVVIALSLALDLFCVSSHRVSTMGVRTLPSDALVTKPVTPMLLACFCVKERKLTPCTWPSTLY